LLDQNSSEIWLDGQYIVTEVYSSGPTYFSDPYAGSFDERTINSPVLTGGFMGGGANKDVVGMAVY